MQSQPHDVVVVGGGLAGIVTALECLRAGRSVALVDRDTPERFGGLALWAFGGMALVGTPLQARMKIPDTPERALADWLRFAELGEGDVLPRQWAEHYVQHSRSEVHDWLLSAGVKFMPAVNWVERGMNGDGNSVPRYHIVWGTSRELTRRMIAALREAAREETLSRAADLLAKARLAHGNAASRSKALRKKSSEPKFPDFSARCTVPPATGERAAHQGTPGSIACPMRRQSTPSACTTAPEVSPPATTSWRTPRSTRWHATRASAASTRAPARSTPNCPCTARTASGSVVE